MLFQPDGGTGQAVYSHNVNVGTGCFQSCHRRFLTTAAVGLCKIRTVYWIAEFQTSYLLHKSK